MAGFRQKLKRWPNSFRVYLDDRDVTPLPLVLEIPDYEEAKDLEEGASKSTVLPGDMMEEEEEEIVIPSEQSSESDTSSSSHFRYSLTSPIDLDCLELPYHDDTITKFLERFRTPTPSEEIPIKVSQARLEELMEEKPLFPDKITLSLRETSTFFLLDRPSLTELEGTLEAESIRKDNDLYQYLTIGEGKRRYTRNAETQTKWTVWKSKDVWAPAAEVKDNTAEASTYDLYQSFKDNLNV